LPALDRPCRCLGDLNGDFGDDGVECPLLGNRLYGCISDQPLYIIIIETRSFSSLSKRHRFDERERARGFGLFSWENSYTMQSSYYYDDMNDLKRKVFLLF
jgi:hypothetical protein